MGLRVLKIGLAVAVLAGLASLGTWNYLIFHSLAELFSVIVAAAIFVIAWNVRDTIENGYLLFLGIAFLSVAAIDLAHMLAFKGMGVFPESGSDLATQLWICGRGLEAVSLAIAPVFLTRRVRPVMTFAVYAAATGLLFLSIFLWDIFPVCYVEGRGLTAFKIYTEYGICLVLALAMTRLLLNRRSFRRPILLLLCYSIGTTILSELAFTYYASVYGDFNMLGHLLKIVSVVFIYKAIVETGFRRPYELLYRNLAESERKFRSVVESNVIGVVFADPFTGAVTEANDEYLRIIGRSRTELAAGAINWKAITPPDILAVEEEQLASGEFGATIKAFEKQYVRPDGTLVPVLVSGAFQDVQSRRLVVFVLDNTARKRAEDALRESERQSREAKERAEKISEELARSNKELSQFGYAVSHDLQEPLRTISGFLTLLKERNAGNIDEESAKYISFAVDGAVRMSRLIRDLLEYSRVGNTRSLAAVDVGEVVQEAKANCIAAIQDAHGRVMIENMPGVSGDRRQLVQLFQNLIGNAMKFRRAGIPPEVHVTAECRNGHWLFRVIDNGIGIPEDQFGRLFQLFQRLHARTKYEGTGVGLALCRRIVELHGGRIWIESEPGSGTTVLFTLPQESACSDKLQQGAG